MSPCACGCGGVAPIDRRGVQQRYRRGHHRAPSGVDHPRWNGGRSPMGNGYVAVLDPSHPRATLRGRYVAEHVVVAERALGRPLPGKHPVHHVDGNKKNNVGGNLVICENHAYHMLLERRTRALAACGNASAQRCRICKRYDRQDNITVSTHGRGGHERAYHRSCAAEKRRQFKQRCAS